MSVLLAAAIWPAYIIGAGLIAVLIVAIIDLADRDARRRLDAARQHLAAHQPKDRP